MTSRGADLDAVCEGAGGCSAAPAGLAARAQALVTTVPPSAADLLVAAAWLHNIGYTPRFETAGFPLDGASYLTPGGLARSRLRPGRPSSGARFVARIRGLDDRFREFESVADASSDALTVADNTTAPDGRVVILDERYATSSSGADRDTQRPAQPRARWL